MHEDRLESVLAEVKKARPRRVLELGCGGGDFLLRLAADLTIEQIMGVDVEASALARLRGRLQHLPAPVRDRVVLINGSMTDYDPRFKGFDTVVLVESIEHVDPTRLSEVERTIFHHIRPRTVVMTTPNADFNPLLGVPDHRFRHPGHRFEWGRRKFQSWTSGVADRAKYTVRFADLAGAHPLYGGASQMAVFTPAVRPALS